MSSDQKAEEKVSQMKGEEGVPGAGTGLCESLWVSGHGTLGTYLWLGLDGGEGKGRVMGVELEEA